MKKSELLEIAKPILFDGEMIRAILDGRKTVTRRVMKPQPLFYTGRKYIFADDVCPKKWEDCDNIIDTYKYQPGDYLYVRESFSPNYFDSAVANYRSGELRGNRNAYKADYYKDKIGHVVPEPKWIPSIHMPKEAARIFLRVTDVKVERLQEITEEGVISEGICEEWAMDWWKPTYNDPDSGGYPMYRDTFAYDLWNSTIKKTDLDKYGWAANPWVWVIGFERVLIDG